MSPYLSDMHGYQAELKIPPLGRIVKISLSNGYWYGFLHRQLRIFRLREFFLWLIASCSYQQQGTAIQPTSNMGLANSTSNLQPGGSIPRKLGLNQVYPAQGDDTKRTDIESASSHPSCV